MAEEKNGYVLSRALYKEIKGMNRDRLQEVLTNIYLDGAKSVGSSSVDLDVLRTEIGKIKGVGENRLNEIMAVIEKALNSKTE